MGSEIRGRNGSTGAPLTRARKTLPSFEQTFRKLTEALADFDVGKVRYEDIQRSAIMAIPAQE